VGEKLLVIRRKQGYGESPERVISPRKKYMNRTTRLGKKLGKRKKVRKEGERKNLRTRRRRLEVVPTGSSLKRRSVGEYGRRRESHMRRKSGGEGATQKEKMTR